MLTDEDIKKLAKKFATKIDLDRLEVEMKLRLERIEENMATRDDFRKFMTMVEGSLREFKKIGTKLIHLEGVLG